MRLVLCTGNEGKVDELRELLPGHMELLSLADLGLPTDLPETCDTLEGNALQKARYVFERCGLPCLADDTGLEVTALNGAPGVRSARYAGPEKDPVRNMQKLLEELGEGTDRSARFRTVIALVRRDLEQCFEGVVNGSILVAPQGGKGFGYDPVFRPAGFDRSFAEMDRATKNGVSHRGEAVRKVIAFLVGSH